MVLPANFPNLLANGTSGIAVGMATSVPPHNVDELCAALLHLIKHPNAHIDKLVEMVPGPDFPTGGIIVEPREAILEAYKTGRGGFRLRARWEREETGSWHLSDHRHRSSLPGAEGQAGGAPGRADQRQEGAAARRRARRVGGDRAAGAGAQEPRRRSGAADGKPVQADRARGALLAQYECAVRRPGAGRAVVARRAQALAGSPPGRAGAALQVPPAKDRASARGARRLPDRLSQPRRGDQDRSLRGRAQGASSSSASS